MKIFITSLCLIAVLSFAKAQSPSLDSLRNVVNTATVDTTRVLTLLRIGLKYYYSKPDSAIYYAQKGYSLAKEANFILGQTQSLSIIANLYYSKGDYIKALEIHFQVLDIQEKRKDTTAMAGSYNNMAMIYEEQEDYKNAIDYYAKAKSIFEAKKISGDLLFTLLNTGNSYEKMDRLDSALFYEIRARELAFKIKDTEAVDAIFSNLGTIYYKLNKLDTSLMYYRSSIPYARNIDDKQTLSEAQLGISRILKERSRIDSSILYAKQSLAYSTEISDPKAIVKVALLLSNLYELQNNTDSAYWYYKKATQTKDTLFNAEIVRKVQIISTNDLLRKKEVQDAKVRYQNKVRWIILLTVLGTVLILSFVLYRGNQQKQEANALLQKKNTQIEHTLNDLKSTQAQLIQKEKMASLGELTAGIAHEIQNPLNFVNNFSEVNKEMLAELKNELTKGNYEEVKLIATDLEENEEKINHHGRRADAIVKNMLQHSRSSTGEKQLTNINALADEYLRLSYHGLRAKDKSFNAVMKTDFGAGIGTINLVPQDIGRVLLNLFNNAFYAVQEKKKKAGEDYEPTVWVSTKKIADKIEIIVKDNGMGISKSLVDKIFQPFFTTKPTGEGTGLGLSLSYDIVTAHGGDLRVESEEGDGAKFILLLPFT